MKRGLFVALCVWASLQVWAKDEFDSDVIAVQGGEVVITFIGHGTLMLEYDGVVIHVDPVGTEADYGKLPTADIVLVTHEHGDHFDSRTIEKIRTSETIVIQNQGTARSVRNGLVLYNGEHAEVRGIMIEAVAAYNTSSGKTRFHPKGRDNGYILTLGGERFYLAGDTEDTDEMLALQNIRVAFLPCNQPYTMLPEQVARAALAFRPDILYPYHFAGTDPTEIVDLLAAEPDIEVRIRGME